MCTSLAGLAVVRPGPYHDEGPLAALPFNGVTVSCTDRRHWALIVYREMGTNFQHVMYLAQCDTGVSPGTRGDLLVKDNWCLRKIQPVSDRVRTGEVHVSQAHWSVYVWAQTWML